MGQIIKTYLSVFLILFMTVVSISILDAYLQVLKAQDMQAQMVDEIENSNYAPSVVQDCFAGAGEAGYELALTYYFENGGVVCCTGVSQIPTDVNSINMACVELTFPLEIGVFGFSRNHTFSGCAK